MNLPKLVSDQLSKAKKNASAYKSFLTKLGKRRPKDLDAKVEEIHYETFKKIDCLACANCCKTTSPIFRMVDIERIAKHFRQKPNDLIQQHLHIDGDGDYVLNSSPCTFLGADNYCSIYEVRPNACREYPHTNRKNFYQLTNLTLSNTQICPATVIIVDRLMEAYPTK